MKSGPRALLRTKEPIYKELGLDKPDVTDEELLDALAEHPSLVQRPIVERGNRAVLGRPVDRVGPDVNAALMELSRCSG